MVLFRRSQENTCTKETPSVLGRLFSAFPGETALSGKEKCLTWPAKKRSHGSESFLRSRSSVGEHLHFSWRVSSFGISLPAEIENGPPQVFDTTMVRTLSWGACLGQPKNEKRIWSIRYKSVCFGSKQIEERVDLCFSPVWWRLLHSHSVFHFCWKVPNRSQILCFLEINMNLTLTIQWRGKCSSLKKPFFFSGQFMNKNPSTPGNPVFTHVIGAKSQENWLTSLREYFHMYCDTKRDTVN